VDVVKLAVGQLVVICALPGVRRGGAWLGLVAPGLIIKEFA
jgi:hypothetical protein